MSKLTRSNSHDNISLNPVSKIIHSKPTAHGAGEASLGAKDDATAMSSSNKHIVSSPNGIAASVLTMLDVYSISPDTIRGFRPELHCKATLSNAEHMMAVAQTKELSLPVDFLPGEDDVKVREDVTCEGPKRKTVCHGELIATKYRLLFVTKPPEPVQVLVNIPIGMISQIEKVGGQKFSQISDTAAYGIAVDCKDLRRYFFGSAREQHQRRNLFNLLTALVFPFSLNKPDPKDSLQFFSSFFAWNYKKRVFPDKIDEGWTVYNKVADYTRMGIRRTGADHWLINTEINQNYELCDTYPNVLVVPANFDSVRIFSVAAFRSRNRLPVLSWYCRKTSATITRASQPLTGLNRKSQDDVEYLNEIANTNFNGHSALFIMDARPKVNAIANKGNGGGYEDYSNCELEFQNIQNIHVMRESLSKLYSAIRHGSQEDKTWFNDSANSNWLLHIRAIMASVQRIVTLIDIDQRSVLVHCSDGWDRTAQLTSLSMLTLDPYYRTLIGFITLIEKEWISFGHKFLLRIGHGDKIYSERSPVFLQFLDCTYQLLQEFGSAFEFNEKLLLTIADALHSCQYGTFLLNSDKSRTTMRASEQTMSLWTDVLRDYKKNYLNPSYNAQALHVLPIHSTTIQIDLWNNYYCQHQAEHQSATDQASGHRFPTLFHIRHKLAADSTFPRNDDDDSSQTKSRTSSYAHTGTHDFDSQTAF